jgi:hypothetical protein
MDENMNPTQAWRIAAPANNFNVAYSSGTKFSDIHEGSNPYATDASGLKGQQESLTGLVYPFPDEDDLVAPWIASGT